MNLGAGVVDVIALYGYYCRYNVTFKDLPMLEVIAAIAIGYTVPTLVLRFTRLLELRQKIKQAELELKREELEALFHTWK